MRSVSEWHLYLVRAGDGSLYTGIATDVERRFADHCAGGAKAAKYLRSRNPLVLAFATLIGSRTLALKAEARMKKLSKAEKEQIVAAGADRDKLLEILALDASD